VTQQVNFIPIRPHWRLFLSGYMWKLRTKEYNVVRALRNRGSLVPYSCS